MDDVTADAPRPEPDVSQPPVLDICIGYDSHEVVAYHVLCQSIVEHSSRPVRFTPLNLANLKLVFDRAPVGVQSTEFSFSRFLTPYLAGYAGWSLFMDCDMLMRGDVAELFALPMPNRDALCSSRFFRCSLDSIHWFSVFGKLS